MVNSQQVRQRLTQQCQPEISTPSHFTNTSLLSASYLIPSHTQPHLPSFLSRPVLTVQFNFHTNKKKAFLAISSSLCHFSLHHPRPIKRTKKDPSTMPFSAPIHSGTTVPGPNNTPGLHQGNPRPAPKRMLRLTPTRQTPPPAHAVPIPEDLPSPQLGSPNGTHATNQQQLLLTPGSNGSSTHAMTTRSATSAALDRGAPLDSNSPPTPSATPSSSNSSGAGPKRCRSDTEPDEKIHETRSVAKRRKSAESSSHSAPLSEQSVAAASENAGHGEGPTVPLPVLQRTRGAQREFEEGLRNAE